MGREGEGGEGDVGRWGFCPGLLLEDVRRDAEALKLLPHPSLLLRGCLGSRRARQQAARRWRLAIYTRSELQCQPCKNRPPARAVAGGTAGYL